MVITIVVRCIPNKFLGTNDVMFVSLMDTCIIALYEKFASVVSDLHSAYDQVVKQLSGHFYINSPSQKAPMLEDKSSLNQH